MTDQLVNLFTTAFSANVELLLQERGPRLRPYVNTSAEKGAKMKSPVNQFGAVTMKKVTSRLAPKTPTNAATARRWVTPTDYTLDQPVDTFDLLKTIVDPKSPLAENAMLAAGRQMDDIVIDAAFATAYTGEDGTGTEAFDNATYEIAATFGGPDSGLTVGKMIETKRLFRTIDSQLPDMEPLTLAAGPTQESNLLNQATVTSKDFNERPVLVDGQVTRFVGFGLIFSNRVDLDATDTDARACIAFLKSGMHLAVWQEVKSNAHQRFDLEGDPWELSTIMSMGATRKQQGKVVRVLAKE